MTLKEWFAARQLPDPDRSLACGASAHIRKGEGRLLKSGGQWLFDNEISHIDASPEGLMPQPGDILKVHDFDGFPLGFGFYNPHSKIRIRMLSRYEKEGISPAFLRQRLKDAWNYRRAVTDIASCRLIFGEADFLPGLTVDKFEDILVVESLALGIDRLKLLLLRDLTDILEEDGIRIRGIYERSDAKVRELEGLERVKGFIGPEFDTLVPIQENGIRYIVDVKEGQKTGFFLDQKDNRAAVARLVRRLSAGMEYRGSIGKACVSDEDALSLRQPDDNDRCAVSVLDCFTHTGSFGLNAAAAGAGTVLSVDASETAIAQARENARLNSLDGIVRYQTADVFELLPQLEKEGKRFDLVILDPPAFTKSRAATKNAVKGYREINLRGMRLVKNGGYLATCSCSHFMTADLFSMTIEQAARSAHRRLRQIEFRTQGPDHPILWGDEESYYLKFYIFQVLEEM